MDFVYPLFILFLCTATFGFALLCDRLSPRK